MRPVDFKEMLELAQGLQASNVKEVSELAKEFLTLHAEYVKVTFKATALEVTLKHYNTLKRLED